MADDTQIPADEFTAAVGRLDPAEFAAFVGDVWRGTADEVWVDPPVVSVRSGTDQSRLLVLADGSDPPEVPGDVDAVVTTEERPPETDPDVPTVGPTALRQRLLYGLPPAEADSLCERVLGMPARSSSYAPAVSSVGAGEDSQRAEGSESPGSGGLGGRVDGLSEHLGTRVAVSLVLAVLLLTAGGMAVLVGGLGPGETRSADGGDTDLAAPDPAAGSNESTGSVGEATAATGTVTPTATPTASTRTGSAGETEENTSADLYEHDDRIAALEGTDGDMGTDRYADLEPTCNRSYLHVVQIQMNALRYNDNGTNDGIRTVRRFASPQNREAVGSVEQYVELLTGPIYAPMLSYDSVEYTPERTREDRALVRVETSADGHTTGQYVFRLHKQDGGEYDGCWMTDVVRTLAPE